jgi:hypothetical protein
MRRIVAKIAVLAVIFLPGPIFGADGWVRIEADNGAGYGIDLGSVGRLSNGVVYTRMCQLDVDQHHCIGGATYAIYVKILWFDCRGHYADMTHSSLGTRWEIAAPNSVIGRASELTCERAKSLPKEYQPP